MTAAGNGGGAGLRDLLLDDVHQPASERRRPGPALAAVGAVAVIAAAVVWWAASARTDLAGKHLGTAVGSTPGPPPPASDPAELGEPDARRYAAMASGAGGVLITGGQGSAGVLDDSWRLIDLAAWTWSPIGDPRLAPPPRSGATLDYVASRGSYLRFGGSARPVSAICPPSCPIPELTDDLWGYDPAEDAWEVLTVGGPQGRFGHGSAFDPAAGVLVVFGGVGDSGQAGFRAGGLLGDTWTLNVTTLDWSRIDPGLVPAARAYHGMAYHPGRGLMYLWGGRTSHRDGDPEVWAYQAATRRWILVGPGNDGPPARWRHAMAVGTDGRLVIIGGELYARVATSGGTITELTDSAEVWAWDPETEDWERLADLPMPLSGISAAALDDGRIIVSTGEGLLVYEPDEDRWLGP
jgi:hypothetical protein